MSIESLQKDLVEIEKQLNDPAIASDYRQAAELSKRYAEIKRQLEQGAETGSPKEIIVEIRAGAGGDEAALFAANLFGMYKKYALTNGWSIAIIDSNQNTLGGYKYLTFELHGQKVFQL